jgi:hypothetical protein
MGKASPARRPSRLIRNGLRDLPDNAAWLLSKALKPVTLAAAGDVSGAASSTAEAAGAAKSSVRQKAKAARRSVAGAVPLIGHDSVAALMREADAAAERAHDQEARALSPPQWRRPRNASSVNARMWWRAASNRESGGAGLSPQR